LGMMKKKQMGDFFKTHFGNFGQSTHSNQVSEFRVSASHIFCQFN
jgi:hypothetical protein